MNHANPDFVNKVHLGEPWAGHWLRFEKDMKALGLAVHECAGWNGWGGPAVTIPSERLPEIREATKVRLDTHAVDGTSVMAYPASIDPDTGETFEEILTGLRLHRACEPKLDGPPVPNAAGPKKEG